MPEERVTILRPPEPDPKKAPIENVLEITELSVLGPDIFTNARQPWHPPGARGVYGGAVIAHCLSAGQETVPEDFLPHSCHCYFLLAGSSTIPILYYVERVRDGKSFATRTVQARQKGKCIFTTTISFSRATPQRKEVRHAAPLPEGVAPPADDWDDEPGALREGPLQSHRIEVTGINDPGTKPHERKCRQWMRCRGKISGEAPGESVGNAKAHLNALAYMSDSYFIGTVSRIHGLWRYPFLPSQVPDLPAAQARMVSQLCEFEGMGAEPAGWEGRPQVGMMVSLDHSIYFHEPRRVRADEWMFTEMESPWSGEGRGVVMQRIFAADGTLLASCVQEGVIRLKQDEGEKSAKL
ncbi:hypothetical protein N3K66_000191 [Trichothecium roseum]|uniref:Uncharacterized protein n=1 Tax=Trichothecium roseum TaxID=47278 RepID=A0ACC0VB96_9HYPO|nr:hypothetical protein N3K66_000191 [Trichothecium roseum]